MTKNTVFPNYSSTVEQNLIENLIIESIQIYGLDIYYCPRTIKAKDEILNEDRISEYNSSYSVELYIKNTEGFEGEGDLLSKFNIVIRDQTTFTMAKKRYNDVVGAGESNSRPQEGDLIYLPLTGKVYVITFVEHEAIFYQMGTLQTYDLRCELFEYSNESLNTGISAIDDLETEYSTNVGLSNNVSTDANGNIIIDANTGRPVGASNTTFDDPFADNDTFDTEGDSILDFSETDPFSGGSGY